MVRLRTGNTVYGDFRDDLVRDGFCIIKGAVPKERAAQYVDEMLTWVEDFGLGFDRNDPSTVREEMMPVITEKGMVLNYRAQHEDFVWKVRQEPNVVKAFETVYGTEDLIVSFDTLNINFPNRKDIKPNKPWAHQDQDPEQPGFRCLQGLVNLAPCGDNDGGLVIMRGAHKISQEYHDTFRSEERMWQWTNEWYGFKETGLAWLKERGYTFEKVNAGPGDLILWDSRCPHYNASPTGTQPRFVIYTCYAPVETATPEQLLKKKQAFETFSGSSHWRKFG